MILVVEDSPTCAKFAEHELGDAFPGIEVVTCRTWMQAARHIGRASAVVIDWNLPDGVDANDCGAAQRLCDAGIPFIVWTSTQEDVPADIGGRVVAKGDAGQLTAAIESLRDFVESQ